jgi:chemotaxis protein MotB
MARRHKNHEEHINHEAWAIPYGDLLTLLLAFFVVMYAMSSINEGKYRVLSDSLVAAFRGAPRTIEPIQVGEKTKGSGADIQMTIVQQAMLEGQPRDMLEPLFDSPIVRERFGHAPNRALNSEAMPTGELVTLESVAREVERAMAGLIEEDLIVVRRQSSWVEVEIRTDILFPSGVATLSPSAEKILEQLAAVLAPFPNPIRVEGHTDNVPINTVAFPSNWELSAARAASVVHLFMKQGLAPQRLAVIGLGEYRPVQSNATPEGRNANRRVVLVILSGDGLPEGDYGQRRLAPPPEALTERAPVAEPAVGLAGPVKAAP